LRLLRQAGKLGPDAVIVGGVMVRAFGGGEETGPSPVDRRKPGTKHTLMVSRLEVPLAIHTAGTNANDHTQIIPLVLDFPAFGGGKPGRPKELPDALYADCGYDSEATRGSSGGWGSRADARRENQWRDGGRGCEDGMAGSARGGGRVVTPSSRADRPSSTSSRSAAQIQEVAKRTAGKRGGYITNVSNKSKSII
jgi:hypothetical protein